MKKITVLLLFFVLGFLSVKAGSSRPVDYNAKYQGFLNPTLRGRLSTDQYRQALIELAEGNYSKWQPGMGSTIRDYYLANLSEMKGSQVSVEEFKSLAMNSPVSRISDDFQSNYWVASLVPGTGEINWYQRPPEGDECVLLVPGTNIAWTSIFCGNLLMPVAPPEEPDRSTPPTPPIVPQKEACCGGNQSVTVNGQPINVNVKVEGGGVGGYQPLIPAYPSEITVRHKANVWDIINTTANVATAIGTWFPPTRNVRLIGGGYRGYPQYPTYPQYPNNPFTPINPGGPYSPPNGPGNYPGGPVSPPNGYPASPNNGGFTPVNNGGGFTPVNTGGGFTPSGGGGSFQYN